MNVQLPEPDETEQYGGGLSFARFMRIAAIGFVAGFVSAVIVYVIILIGNRL